MKKLISSIIALSLIFVCFALTAGAATQEKVTSLIVENSEELSPIFKPMEMGGGNVKYSYSGTSLIVENAAGNTTGWPCLNIYFNAAEDEEVVTYSPISIDPDNSYIELKFKIEGSGATSIRLMTTFEGEKGIYLNHYLPDYDYEVVYDGAGDLTTMGEYSFKIKVSDLKLKTVDNSHTGRTDLPLDEDGMLLIEGLQIYSVSGCKVTIEKFDLIVETEVIDESSAVTGTSSTPESSATIPTGDAGYIALAVIAVIALAGAVVVKKVR